MAWDVLPPEARASFRSALGGDEATWTGGAGWALSIALAELRSYRETNPRRAATAGHVVREVLSDHRSRGRSRTPSGRQPIG
ncbi:hypothetical protein [Streptomyces sp. NPDC019208]|uniref:hypothetical protein n=1 Tax=Streptomyces sp. NPDC019208 TaxID=3154683 RepID=UPI0033E19833